MLVRTVEEVLHQRGYPTFVLLVAMLVTAYAVILGSLHRIVRETYADSEKLLNFSLKISATASFKFAT